MKLEMTKTNQPALWECGGGATNTGNAVIICNSKGSKKRPTYVPNGGHLSKGNHALFVVKVGDVVIQADHDRYGESCQIDRIVAINGDEAILENITVFKDDEWSADLDVRFNDAVHAAFEKMHDYHCRSVYYALPRNEKNDEK